MDSYDDAVGELIRLERMVVAQRELVRHLRPVNLLQPKLAPWEHPRAQDRTLEPGPARPVGAHGPLKRNHVAPSPERHEKGCFYYTDSCFRHAPDALPYQRP